MLDEGPWIFAHSSRDKLSNDKAIPIKLGDYYQKGYRQSNSNKIGGLLPERIPSGTSKSCQRLVPIDDRAQLCLEPEM